MANEIYHKSNWGKPEKDGWGDVYFNPSATNQLYTRSDNYENEEGTDKALASKPDTQSVLMTPTAYNVGSMNSVLPPYEVLPTELVTNGDFATDSDWVKGSNWSINNGVGVYTSSGFSNLSQANIDLEVGKKYELTVNLIGPFGNVCRFYFGPSSSTAYNLVNGLNVITGVAVSNKITFRNLTQSSFTIDNVSVKEVRNADFTFDRNSTATRVNKEGLIETVAIDTPRLDYPFIDGVVQDCPALLLEPARTNLFLNSNLFTAWSKEATVTLTANYGISPDGTQNSTRMQMSENDSIYSSTTSGLTASVYVKGVQGETIRLSNGSTVIHTLTGQWDRIEVYDSGSVSTLITINTYLGATARDIELFGAQREAGSYATSYIPTSGSSVTRAAETANGAGTSDDFNSSEGVLYAETAALADDGTSRTISINNTVSNRVFLQLRATSGQVLSGVVKGGVVQGTVMSYSISQTSNIKFLIKYKVNDFALWVNGFEVGTSTGNVFSSGILNDLSFDSGDGAEDFYGKTKEVGVFKTALTDSELEALTSWDSFSDMATGQEYTIR